MLLARVHEIELNHKVFPNDCLNHTNRVSLVKKAEIYDFTVGISSAKIHEEYWLEFNSDNSKPLI